MDVILRERDRCIALETPAGTLILDSVTAARLSTAMEQCARWSVSKETGDPCRARVMRFPLCETIGPAPVPEQGDTAPSDMKGQLPAEPDPVSSGGGITAGPSP
jgi:hypothetical protein